MILNFFFTFPKKWVGRAMGNETFYGDGLTSASWGPFFERPGNLTGPVSYFEIKVSGKVACVQASNEVHFVSLAENFTV